MAVLKVVVPDHGAFTVEMAGEEARLLSGGETLTEDARRQLFTDHVLPRAMSAGVDLCLHGALVGTPGGAIVLFGDSGAGKSTLAAAFGLRGMPVHGDDALRLAFGEDGPRARNFHADIRLNPDSVSALFGAGIRTEPMWRHGRKRRLVEPFGRADEWTRPVALVHLARVEAGPIALGRPAPMDAVKRTLRQTLACDPEDAVAAGRRLRLVTRLVSSTPSLELSYPSDYGALDRVTSTLIDAVAPLADEGGMRDLAETAW